MSIKRQTALQSNSTLARGKDNMNKVGKLWNSDVHAEGKKKPVAVAGTKYSHLGTSRKGIASYMDKDIIEHNLEQREKNYGGGGYRFMMVGRDGKVDPTATLNINGRVHNCRPDGSFYTIDKKYLDLCAREAEERKVYIEDIAQKCAISDEICATILDLDEKEMKRLMNGGDAKQVAEDLGIDIKLAEYNCLPSYMQCLDGQSTFFTGGAAKLKRIVELLLPVIENATPASVIHKGEE